MTMDKETRDALAKFRAMTPEDQADLLAAMEWLTYQTGACKDMTDRAGELWARLSPDAQQTIEGIAAQVIERGA